MLESSDAFIFLQFTLDLAVGKKIIVWEEEKREGEAILAKSKCSKVSSITECIG